MIPSSWPGTIHWKDCPIPTVLDTIFAINQVSILVCSTGLSLCQYHAFKIILALRWVLISSIALLPLHSFSRVPWLLSVLWFSTRIASFLFLNPWNSIGTLSQVFFLSKMFHSFLCRDFLCIFLYLFLDRSLTLLWSFLDFHFVFIYCWYVNMYCLISSYFTNPLFPITEKLLSLPFTQATSGQRITVFSDYLVLHSHLAGEETVTQRFNAVAKITEGARSRSLTPSSFFFLLYQIHPKPQCLRCSIIFNNNILYKTQPLEVLSKSNLWKIRTFVKGNTLGRGCHVACVYSVTKWIDRTHSENVVSPLHGHRAYCWLTITSHQRNQFSRAPCKAGATIYTKNDEAHPCFLAPGLLTCNPLKWACQF